MIWSTPLATTPIYRSADVVSGFTVASTPLLICSEGMSSIPGNLPVFTGASTSTSTGGLSSLSVKDRLSCSMVSSSQLYMSK